MRKTPLDTVAEIILRCFHVILLVMVAVLICTLGCILVLCAIGAMTLLINPL